MRGWPKILTKEQHELHPYFCRRQELTVVQDLLYWGQRVVIPGAAQKEMLNLLHEAHQGATAMKRVARTLFWWPGLDGEVPTIRPHAAVWYRNFGQGEKWLPGVVESNHGARMTVVSTPGGNVRRHLDQLRLREVKAETSEAPAASGSAVPAPSPRSPADQLARAAAASGSAVPVPSPTSPADQLARAAVPAASAKSPANELYGDATTSSEPEDSCVPFQLRRSTRTRKPIDRLQL
ncbi:uncharacterized protein LOC115331590 isoform X2 [Ixodes scapularis]|uniref:uncharacterized protein LOC120836125 n=2 Tax=Ixodes scapularis TaxID=6945 RepID=UPI001A9D2206|nr:uncharacterized protein LOC120836125 [Ixodes scapularis]XP_040074497.1 uncharacterized protein LOC115331590 isoform X2 [Ixodes scapularis]